MYAFGCLLLAATIAACPSVPNAGIADASDAVADGETDATIPLSLDRLRPGSGMPEGGERVSIFGAGIVKGAKVSFGEVPATGVLVLDGNQINCNSPPAEQPGLVDVTVRLPDGSEETLPQAYLYRGPLQLESIEPTISPSMGGINVTITGAGFDNATQVLVGGRLLIGPERLDENTITGILPARLQGAAGPVSVVATNGFEQRVLDRAFTFVDSLRVDWMSRSTGSVDGGTITTLYGTGMVAGSIVVVGGKAAETVATGGGESLTIRIPPNVEGRQPLSVNNGLETYQVPQAFSYVQPEDLVDPNGDGVALLGAYPRQGNASGGQQVALAVWGLPLSAGAQGLSVTFNGVPAQVVEVRAYDHQVVVITPTGAPGDAEIKVSAPAGEADATGLYTFQSDFEVTFVTPATGTPAGGEEVVITGKGLDESAVVFFGSQLATTVSHKAESLRVTVPAGVPGRVDVRIAVGEHKSLVAKAYEYRAEGSGRLLAVTPPRGAQAGSRLVRLYGHGFRAGPAPAIEVGGSAIEADIVEVVDDATIHIRSPRAEIGEATVSAGSYGLIAMAYETFDPTGGYGGTANGTIPEALNITVLEMGTRAPIEDAFVILWDDLGTPYQGVTDDRGQLVFSDPMFGPPQMVTASKDNHSTASLVDFDARDATLLLINYTPSPSGPPGTGGPQQLPPSNLTGAVGGTDKYIVPPPGNCDPYVGKSGTVCDVCQTDEDCAEEGERCTPMQEQGNRCTIGCLTDADCDSGFVCKGVGKGFVQCVPSPGEKEVWCGTTKSNIFAYDSDPNEVEPPTAEISGLPITGFTGGDPSYLIATPPGEYAVICFGGYIDTQVSPKVFTPTVMGVRRHAFAAPGETVFSQDIKLDIPLTRSLDVRLDGAPLSSANYHMVDTFIDFGADGVFRMPARIQEYDTATFTLHRFPSKFEESLYDASYTFYARAYNDPDPSLATRGSFVLHQEVVNPYADSVFKIREQGVAYTSTGIDLEVHDMHSWGGTRVWGAADEGNILTYDGDFWGRVVTPVPHTLRSVWAASDDYVWAVGDHGSVVRGDGISWKVVDMPRSLEDVAWRGVFGVGADVWIWGSGGIFIHDGVQVHEQSLGDSAGRPEDVTDVWGESPDSVWLVGAEGLIRRFNGTNFEAFDSDGADFAAVSGSRADNVWAVGEGGRIAHWDGNVWFDFLPITRFDLKAVHAVSDDEAWASGDNGVVLRWDGLRWEVQSEIEHIDLRSVRVNSDGSVLTGGIHTLILGPFLDIPTVTNPAFNGQWTPWSISWTPGKAPDPTVTVVSMRDNGFPFWTSIVAGHRSVLPLPDLPSAWGINPFPAFPVPAGSVQLLRVYIPGESIDRFDNTMLNEFSWRSWSIVAVPAVWPTP